MEHVQIIGCHLTGVLFNTFLFGIVSQRYVTYFLSGHARSEEQYTVKMMVSLLCLLDTTSTASLIYAAWRLAIVDYNNPSALMAITPWPICFNPIVVECTAMTTQMFLTSRLWRLRRSRLLVGIAIALATMSFATGVAAAVEMLVTRFQSNAHRGPQGFLGSLILSWSALQVVTDVFITVSLIVILCQARKGLAIPSARREYGRIIDVFIHGSIQTGVLAGGWAIGTLVALIAWPTSDLSGAISICMGRIYTITLLDILICRPYFKGDIREGTTSTKSSPQLTSVVEYPTFEAVINP
ncbi:hypothetical protein CONPUDRAFT_169850 [Coniophora puteana RWD-64-598 SS2]|uniref:DUF6534 domain-containing protein n=1 Tax=Coniophora puteana (strain RWD-64-598) TaxID=741705 RepID=A0A5M3M872_CONPW|nr:uncharacterized protein CONPUDRAFT_169850 [Coniophora puteana RWD-64-598 SS2]EIW74985.1 hypothetical protein CONPUDRAFT_169850 [Coniophora puteana RWD-64-598 SS2]